MKMVDNRQAEMDAENGNVNHIPKGTSGVNNGSFDYRLQSWFESLTLEARSQVLLVNDAAFFSSLLKLSASQSSSSISLDQKSEDKAAVAPEENDVDSAHVAPKSKSTSKLCLNLGQSNAIELASPTTFCGQDSQVDPLIKCDWNKEILLTDFEKLYTGNCVSVGVSSMTPSSMKIASPTHESSTLGDTAKSLNGSIIKEPFVEMQECKVTDEVASSRQLSKASDAAVGGSDADRIQRARTGSDVIRIQGNWDAINFSSISKDSPCDLSAEIVTVPETFTIATPNVATTLLSQIHLGFPSVLEASERFGPRSSIEEGDDNSSPVLVFPPSVLKNVTKIDFPLKGLSHLSSTTWLEELREHVRKTSPSSTNLSASLSLVMLSRIQAAVTECFGRMKDTSESNEIILAPLKKNRNLKSIEDGNQTGTNTLPLQNESKEFCQRLQGTHPTKTNISIYDIIEVVNKFATGDEFEEMHLLGLGESSHRCLPFIPLDSIIGFEDAQLKKLNAILGNSLATILPRAFDAGYFSPQTPLRVDGVETCAVVECSEQATNCNACIQVEVIQHGNLSSRKRKKKKKKKRKVPNTYASEVADASAHSLKKVVKEETAPKTDVEEAINLEVTDKLQSNSLPRGIVHETKVDAVTVNELCHSPKAQERVLSQETSERTLDPSPANEEPQDTKPPEKKSLLSSPDDAVQIDVSNMQRIETPFERTKVPDLSADSTIQHADDDDEWETVEAKGKNKNRNKSSGYRAQSGKSSYHNQTHCSGQRKLKSGRTSASRKRMANRKVVREILGTILDSVDAEVRRRRLVDDERKRRSAVFQKSRSDNAPPVASTLAPSLPVVSMRDIVMGKQTASPRKLPTQRMLATAENNAVPAGIIRACLNGSSQNDVIGKLKSKSTHTLAPGADQSTAPTLPDTLSGTSANTHSSIATEEVDNSCRVPVLLDDDSSSVVDKEREDEPSDCKTLSIENQESSPQPPLPTLLGTGNTNSATSSVASSLEAPHASSHRHHHSSGSSENDVGYHLLDVCDRISRDMSVFMARRAAALTARRRERHALLGALQDTVTNLWGGRGTVEMYGSCATHLDLPSSDLDAVILGLDSVLNSTAAEFRGTASEQVLNKQQQRQSLAVESNMSTSYMILSPNTPTTPKKVRNQFHQHIGMNPYGIGRQSNGERVMILAAELERLPWAVQVKAISTASVPVVKVLADPSKLPGAVNTMGSGGDWMLHQHHMAAQAAAAANVGIHAPPPITNGQVRGLTVASLSQSQSSYPLHTPPPWRGADVMNGLFSLDITFEGPEHGGIGSTRYSSDVVQEACRESGLPPEQTPFVQVLMVLKELLAQRRLNEPFSGGLSSYALLLLTKAVTTERAIIREEMERMERHRELVTASDASIATDHVIADKKEPESTIGMDISHAGSPNRAQSKITASSKGSTAEPSSKQVTPKKSKEHQNPKTTNARGTAPIQQAKKAGSRGSSAAPASSWATIAKKNSPNLPTQLSTVPNQIPSNSLHPKGNQKQPQKATSFAEAVSRKQQATQKDQANQNATKQLESMDKKKESHQKHPTTSSSIIAEDTHHNSRTLDLPFSHPKKHTQSLQTANSNAPERQSFSPKEVKKETSVQNRTNSFVPLDPSLSGAPSLFPQGSNDVLEVLCSGETTAGKLLMHFLLFYGEHFDSRGTAIDVAGYCTPDWPSRPVLASQRSPYAPRHSGGTIDPITGMLTVDPIVVYDPWEGGQGNNVARSCYAWSSIRWHFAQCYMTLSSAVERGGSSTSPSIVTEASKKNVVPNISPSIGNNQGEMDNCNGNAHPPPVDVSPLLELLLSF